MPRGTRDPPRARRGLSLALAACTGCLVMCAEVHDYTEYRELPPAVPDSQRAVGEPRYSAVFEGSSTAFDAPEFEPDEESAARIVRQLRVARVFETIYAPGSPSIPSDAARMRSELRFRSLGHTSDQFAEVPNPEALAHRYDLEGTIELFVALPTAERPLVYEARTVASRTYYAAEHMAGPHEILRKQVESVLVAGVIDQLRAEARLRLSPL